MIGLLRTYLRPYTRRLAIVIALLLVQAIGNLYLPDLNGDIINNGVLRGDTNYVLSVGGLMLLVTAVVGIAAISSVNRPMEIPATGFFNGTPASSSDNVAPHTDAIEVEPFDSMISEVTRIE